MKDLSAALIAVIALLFGFGLRIFIEQRFHPLDASMLSAVVLLGLLSLALILIASGGV